MPRVKQTIVINTRLPLRKGSQRPSWVPLWCCALVGLTFISTRVLSLFGLISLPGEEGWKTIAIGSLLAAPLLYYWLRAQIARCVTRHLVPDWQLQNRLNADYATLAGVMSRNDVRPRAIVDGKRFYSQADFAEITFLLRASAAPKVTDQALLRPAADVESSAEQLLHPTEAVAHPSPHSDRLRETEHPEVRRDSAEQGKHVDVNRLG